MKNTLKNIVDAFASNASNRMHAIGKVAFSLALTLGLAHGAQAEEEPDYLTFTAQEDGSTVTFSWESGSDVMINTNGTWVAYSKNTTIKLANTGDKVMFKGSGVTTKSKNKFTMTGKIAASGDVGTLTDGKGGAGVKLGEKCFQYMFYGCTSLTTAPKLPAMDLSLSCYTATCSGVARR